MSNNKREIFQYYRRIFSAYLTKKNSHLTFWHGTPEVNENAPIYEIGEYYMPFLYKAKYKGPFDNQRVPLLDYKGKIGKQYNPIAIAQYALGHYNIFKRKGDVEHLNIFLNQANWLVEHLEKNRKGLYVWNHYFDWEYRTVLKAPWYSALSQGQGISVLVRAFLETQQEKYENAAKNAFKSFENEISEGGVRYTDEKGYIWFEEAITNPPTHILNGFIWSLWGVYDYFLFTKEKIAEELFNKSIETLEKNLRFYDINFWSLYDLSQTKLRMIASPFYHNLHIVQLKILYKLTRRDIFKHYADKWNKYREKRLNRNLALIYKILFKLLYY